VYTTPETFKMNVSDLEDYLQRVTSYREGPTTKHRTPLMRYTGSWQGRSQDGV